MLKMFCSATVLGQQTSFLDLCALIGSSACVISAISVLLTFRISKFC